MKLNALVLTCCLFLLSGCATLPEGAQRSSVDPFERMNRATFAFNDTVDQAVFRPVARTYVNIMPNFVQTGVGNFFDNIGDVWTTVNCFLQGNVAEGFSGVMRVTLNSTFGLLGLVDVASEVRIPEHSSDFGQTLGVWGVSNGPYLVIPFLGPSVLRDTAALPVDYYADLWSHYRPISDRNHGSVLRAVDKRASYLEASSLLEDAALDKYIFTRDAYLQRVASQIESRRNARNEQNDAAEQRQEDKSAVQELSVTHVPADIPTNALTIASAEAALPKVGQE